MISVGHARRRVRETPRLPQMERNLRYGYGPGWAALSSSRLWDTVGDAEALTYGSDAEHRLPNRNYEAHKGNPLRIGRKRGRGFPQRKARGTA